MRFDDRITWAHICEQLYRTYSSACGIVNRLVRVRRKLHVDGKYSAVHEEKVRMPVSLEYINIGSEKYVRTQCLTCGSYLLIPTVVFENKKYYGGVYYCHAGHNQGWTKESAGRNRRAKEDSENREEIKKYNTDNIHVLHGGKDNEEEKPSG